MLCEKYKVVALGHDSHLFTSPIMMDDFPGRRFRIRRSSNGKELNRNLDSIKQANIAVRHFPLSANELRKRLKLRDGGNTSLRQRFSRQVQVVQGTYINDNGEGVTPSPLFCF